MTVLLPRVATVEAQVDVGNCLLFLRGVQPHAAVYERERVDNYRVEGNLFFLRDRQKRLPEKERVDRGRCVNISL